MFFRRPELFIFFEMIILPRQLRLKNETPSLVFTWAQRQVKDSRRSGMSHSCFIYLFIFQFIRGRNIYFIGFPGV